MAQLLINHKKKFIFIHIHKTGGNSVGKFLKELNNGTEEYPTLSAFRTRERYPGQFDSYYKFSIVRNPWGRFVSWYTFARQWDKVPARVKNGHWRFIGGDPRNMEFSDWLLNTIFYHNQYPKKHNVPVQALSQFEWITDEDGKVMVDYIADLSNINEGWKTICDKIGVEYAPLSKENTTRHKKYQDYYTPAAIKHVEKVAAPEIEHFGYEF